MSRNQTEETKKYFIVIIFYFYFFLSCERLGGLPSVIVGNPASNKHETRGYW